MIQIVRKIVRILEGKIFRLNEDRLEFGRGRKKRRKYITDSLKLKRKLATKCENDVENYGPLEYCIAPIDFNSLLWIFQGGNVLTFT